MAYRTAEQTRWGQFDFVVGYEIKLSQRHPCHDVCDTLAGKYSKTFKWTGWHPMDMCFSVSILKTDDEFWSDSPGSRNEVKDVPQGFKDWVRDNADRIAAAEERGTQPYFIRDNKEAIEGFLKSKEQNNADKETKVTAVGNPLSELQKKRRDEIKRIMLKKESADYSSSLFSKNLTLPNKSVREWLNQPHYALDAKNEAIIVLQDILKTCKRKIKITIKPKHEQSVSQAYALPFKLKNRQSYIIIHVMKWGEIKIYGISDNDRILDK